MSQISLKSISGITSITTPAGVDNQLTIHTNDTTERLKVTTSGINVTGVVTATSFQGDGSALTGIAADKIFEGNTEAEVVDTGSNGHFKVTTEGTEKFRIDSSGRVLIGTTTEGAVSGDNFTIASNTGYCGMTIRSGTSSEGNIFFSDATSGNGESVGMLRYEHNNDAMVIKTANTERLRIKSDGATFLQTSNVNINRGTSGAGYPLTVRGPSSGDVIRLERANSGQWHFGFDGSTNFYLKSNTTEVVRINTDGKLLIGHNAAQSVGGGNSLLQIQATNSTGRISVVQHRNEAGGSPFISLGKSRGTSNGSTTILQSGDEIGTLTWAGADGNDLDNQACCITGVVDGTPGSNDMPGRLEFRTTADGSASATTRMKISKEGYVTKPNHPAFHARLENNTSSTTNPLVYGDVRVNNGSHYKSSGSDAGKFVAPVAGIYFFYLVAVKYNNGSVCRLYPHVNGSKIYNQMHLRLQETGTYSNGSLQFCYTCSAGDKVHISLEAGQVLGAEYTHFGGFLLG